MMSELALANARIKYLEAQLIVTQCKLVAERLVNQYILPSSTISMIRNTLLGA